MRFLALALSLIAFAGCIYSPADKQMYLKLKKASPNRDAGYFRLPDADDLAAIPQDPNNPLTPEKVELGKFLFHETGLLHANVRDQGYETVSCASCHHAGGGFQANVQQGIGEGGLGFGIDGSERVVDPSYEPNELDVQPLRSPSVLNVAYQDVMLWNGQFGGTGTNAGTEAQWAEGTPLATNALGYQGVETQAIAGLTVHRLASDGSVSDSIVPMIQEYRRLFELAYPEATWDERFSDELVGLAIAAYERTLLPTRAPFQRWLRGDVRAMTERQKLGAVIFFGKGRCVSCHTGPALNSMSFHALGMDDLTILPDVLGPFSVDHESRLGRGGFTGNEAEHYRFKTPQLYNLTDSPFYGHGASFRSLAEVVAYKNRAVPENADVPEEALASDFRPLHLARREQQLLIEFLAEGLYDPDLDRYVPEELPTGYDFPVQDPVPTGTF